MDEFLVVLRLLAGVLERVGIPYAIGGSVASSVRGVIRATLDIDIVARVDSSQVDRLVAELGRDWYADADQIRDAVSRGRPFNAIYTPTMHKVDVFPATGAFHDSQLARATSAPFDEQNAFFVTTAEDILLAKLRWYRDDGEVSEKQWSDVAGIVAVNADLDREYLNLWAERLDVADLLAKALASG